MEQLFEAVGQPAVLDLERQQHARDPLQVVDGAGFFRLLEGLGEHRHDQRAHRHDQRHHDQHLDERKAVAGLQSWHVRWVHG